MLAICQLAATGTSRGSTIAQTILISTIAGGAIGAFVVKLMVLRVAGIGVKRE
jgi:hypothetical protein